MIAEFINVIILFFIFPPIFMRAKQFACGTRFARFAAKFASPLIFTALRIL
jgi:hypothetical protein